jgi:DNA repair protein RadA/Sms
MTTQAATMRPTVKRGRPSKKVEVSLFNENSINITTGDTLNFGDDIFDSITVGNQEMDSILSTQGGIMPATNMMVVGGAGAGKTTLTLDWLQAAQRSGKKVLFISGEMDEIGYFKYCKRLPSFKSIPVLFLKHHRDTVSETLTHVFNTGYDLILIDSVAEVLEMYRDQHNATRKQAESWLIDVQDKTKLGLNKQNRNTTFINIQQVSKSGDFVGSNRLKHMMDAMFVIEVNKEKTERTIHFEKNRDGDKEYKIGFSFYNNKVNYAYTVGE